MSAASDFEVPSFGDDGLFPGRRGWVSVPITVMFWALIFTVVYFATRNTAIEDSVAADGYIAALLIAFIITIFFAIPAITLLLGRMMDDGTRKLPAWRAGMSFAFIGALLGVVPAAFIFLVNQAYGWLPFTQLIIPSALAPLLARIALEKTLESRGVRVLTMVFTAIVVVGSLSIGVSVFTGRI
jgi:hypothetical protein